MLTKVIQKISRLFYQTVMVVGAFVMANALRYDGDFPPEYVLALTSLLLPLVVIKLMSFTLMHALSGWWRYVSIHDLITLVKANLLGSLLFAVYLKYSTLTMIQIPVSVVILDGLICFLLMSGTRVAVRLFHENLNISNKSISSNTENILIVGAGAAGQAIAREIRQNPHQSRRVVGFVDQDKDRVNQRFEGVPVLATIDDLKKVLNKKPINLVLLANPVLCHKELREIVMACQSCGVKSKILPNVGEILNDNVSIRLARDVNIEDLLGRPQVDLDVSDIRCYLENKRVLVTGAAGSIGSEICRQVARFGATCVILFDNAETPLFQIDRELKKEFTAVKFITCLGDAKNASQVDYTFRTYTPDVVFHAAAYKHVSMSEWNPLVTLENNIFGTRNLVDAADQYSVKHFVMISTDKAVNPTNIMGASKRVAEHYVQALAQTSETKIATVRFGNVLGSNGSVVPIFKEQIINGGPVTVTDRQATRFFMTIPEAVQLVLQAGSMGKGGEIFVLNMGDQVKILHLAEEMIRLSGLKPYDDIDIVFTGLRPGEKLYEELLHTNENVMRTSHEKICIAETHSHDLEKLNHLLEKLATACKSMDRVKAAEVVTAIVPEFAPGRQTQGGSADLFRVQKPRVLHFPLSASAAETA